MCVKQNWKEAVSAEMDGLIRTELCEEIGIL